MGNKDEYLFQNIYTTMNSQQTILKEIDDIKKELKKVKEQNTQYMEIIQKLEKEKK
jgi:TnpA family transposase